MNSTAHSEILFLIADSNGGYSVPSVKGGAVTGLVEELIARNEVEQLANFTVMSIFDEKAQSEAANYPSTDFIWVRPPRIAKLADSASFFVVSHFFKKKKAISYKSPFSLLCYIGKAQAYLKTADPEALTVVLENNVLLANAIKLSGWRGQYFYHFHNVPRFGRCLEGVFLGVVRHLCVSEFVGREITAPGSAIGQIPESKIEVVRNCIDTDLFRPLAVESDEIVNMRHRLGISDDDRVLIFVGRLTWEKGVDKVLDAMHLISVPGVRLVVVGAYAHGFDMNDEFQTSLRRKADSLADRVVFAGYISQVDMPTIYSMADVSVLPSMWDEPAGLTMVESIACGTPVVTTRSGGIPEYVEGAAVLVERDENIVNEIAFQVERLLTDDDYYRQLSEVGRQRVSKEFSAKDYLRRFLDAVEGSEDR